MNDHFGLHKLRPLQEEHLVEQRGILSSDGNKAHIYHLLRLFPGDQTTFFLYHSVFFSLTLQRNAPVAAVIYSHAPLFARADAALILIQAPVIQIIKIDASDQITSVAARMRIRLHDVLKACLQHLQFGH